MALWPLPSRVTAVDSAGLIPAMNAISAAKMATITPPFSTPSSSCRLSPSSILLWMEKNITAIISAGIRAVGRVLVA